jgi:uncharacterized protein
MTRDLDFALVQILLLTVLLVGTAQVVTSAAFAALMTQTGQDRILEMQNKATPPPQAEFLPPITTDGENLPDGVSRDFYEATIYYRTDRAYHPRSTGFFPRRCYDLFATFDPFNFVHMLSPRPLLMIAGGDADTRIFSEDAIRRAREPKELFIVPGRTHVDMYDRTDKHIGKLIEFFGEYLCA